MRSGTSRLGQFGIIGLTFIVAACAGNDAKKCKVATRDDGSVRVSCPGNAAIIIPPGDDSFSLPEECEATENPSTGVIELICQGQTAALGECGLGFVGHLSLGESPVVEPGEPGPMPIPGSSDDPAAQIERFRSLNCTRIIGSLTLLPGASADYGDILSSLEYVSEIRLDEADSDISLPNLRAAYLNVGANGEVLRTLEIPEWRTGGIYLAGGSYVGELHLPTLESGNVQIGEVSGLTGLSLTSLKSGSLHLTNLPQLESVRLPVLEHALDIQLWTLDALTELSAPLLEDVRILDIAFLNSLTAVEFPRLVSAGMLASFTYLSALESVGLPSLHSANGVLFHSADMLRTVELPNLRKVTYLNVFENPALTLVAADNLSEAGSVLIRENVALSDVSLSRLAKTGSLELEELPVLETFDIGELVWVDSLVSLKNSGVDVEGGIEFTAENLEFSATVTLDGANFNNIHLPKFRGGNLSIQGGTDLTNIHVPQLTNSDIYVSLLGTSADAPVTIDLSNFSHTSTPTSVAYFHRSVEIFAEFGRTVDLKMDSLVNLADMHLYGVTFDQPWIIPAGQEGFLSLSLIDQGSMVDSSSAMGLKRVEYVNVGTSYDRVVADFSSADIESAMFLSSHLHGAKFRGVSNGIAVFQGHGATSPTTATGVLEILSTGQSDDSFSVRIDPNGDQTESTASMFDEIAVRDVPSFALVAYTAAPMSIDISLVTTLSTFTLRTPNLAALNMFSLQRTTNAPLDIEGLPPTAFMVLPAVPAPNVLGAIKGNWVGQFCPQNFLTAFPSVTWTVNCEQPNVIEPG